MRRALASGALFLAWLGSARTARADAPHIDVGATLQYDVAPSCPTVDRFQSKVIARLGYDPFAVIEKTNAVEIRCVEGKKRITCDVLIDRRLRKFETVSTCEPLIETIAATVAIALDPVKTLAPAAPPRKAETTAEKPNSELTPTASASPDTPKPEVVTQPVSTLRDESPAPPLVPHALEKEAAPTMQRWHPFAAAGVGFGSSPTMGVTLRVGTEWRASQRVLLRAAVEGQLGPIASDGIRLHTALISVGACALLYPLRFCLGVATGLAIGQVDASQRAGAVVRVGPRIEFDFWQAGSLGFFALAEGNLNPLLARVRIGEDERYRESLVTAQAGVGIRFGEAK
jgi:hypothetical protein